MDFDKLKSGMQEVTAIAGAVPEPFRERCFEILLTALLQEASQGLPVVAPHVAQTNAAPPELPVVAAATNTNGASPGLALPSNVKAFMRRKGVTQEQIEAVVMVEDAEVHFIREPDHSQAAKGQSDWALLTALKNGILNNSLKADPEEVRSLVQDKGFYDQANFSSNFKKPKYSALFKAPLEPQGEAQALSTDGETALAELITKLAAIK